MIVPLLFVLAAPHAIVKHGPTAMHTTQVKREASKPSVQAPKQEEKKIEGKKIESKKEEKKIESSKVDKKVVEIKKVEKKQEPCFRFPVTITRGLEEDTFALTMCDGSAAPGAIERLSILARPESAQRPKAPISELVKVPGEFVAPGIKRVDERLPHALQTVLDHFDQFGVSRKMRLVSGYRPLSKGSFHATAQALDLHIDGLTNEQIVSFCKTLSDVGCGYYPNSTFVHIDVRAPGTGHVAWVDVSGPGELPYYVSRWPLGPFDDDPRTALKPLPKDAKTEATEEPKAGSADM